MNNCRNKYLPITKGEAYWEYLNKVLKPKPKKKKSFKKKSKEFHVQNCKLKTL